MHTLYGNKNFVHKLFKNICEKLLGKNIKHKNSNKKRGEKPNSLVTKSPHKVSTFVQQHGSDGCYSFCVHAAKENGKNKI